MKSREIFTKTCIGAGCIFMLAAGCFAQRPAPQKAPRQEKLLNGLKLIMLDDRTQDKVSIRVRIHSGSAFDPQGREGVMKLLAESIFPTPESREFFTDDLGGSLEIMSNYDYIQVNASSKSSEFLRLLEAVATAISNPPIDKEIVSRLKTERLAILDKTENDVSYIADRAVLARLFGTFPYGRPELGTKESVQKIEYADLKFAKDRFFGADNATVVISGNFNPDLGYRAARRYLGSWLRSDNKVPATFRQPDEPDIKLFEVGSGTGPVETRFAFRGISRSDKDLAAAEVLTRIVAARLGAAFGKVRVENEARLLPGAVLVAVNSTQPVDPKAVSKAFTEKISDAEYNMARDDVLGVLARPNPEDRWLDAETYKVDPDVDRSFQNATLADVQRVADRFAKTPMVSVVVRGH